MNSVSPLIPIFILLAGAALAAVGTLLKFRYTPAIQVIAAALAVVALAWERQALPQIIVALAWRPISLFGMPVVLNVDSYAWALGLSMLISMLAASMRQLAQDGAPNYPVLMLAMGAAMLVVLEAANVLTLVLAWGMLDVIYCFTLLAREGLAGSRRAELVIGINGLAALLVWATLILLEQDGLSPYWHLMALPFRVRTMLGVAAVLRLGLYPLYAWSVPGKQDDLSWTALLNLMPMLAGLALWLRLNVIQAMPTGDLWIWVALAGAMGAGVLAWSQSDARQSAPYIAIGYTGLLIVAGVGGMTATGLTMGIATWFLGMYALTTSPSFDIRRLILRPPKCRPLPLVLWGLPALIAIAALAGLPATIGATYRVALHAGFTKLPWLWGGLAALAEAMLLGASLRYALASQLAQDSSNLLTFSLRMLPTFLKQLAVPLASLITATLPLVVFGVWSAALAGFEAPWAGVAPNQALDVWGWASWLLPVAGMVVFLIALVLKITGRLTISNRVQSYLARGAQVIGQVLDMAWLYDLAMNSIRRAARLIGSLAALMEGKGALVWMLLSIVLALLLYLRAPGR